MEISGVVNGKITVDWFGNVSMKWRKTNNVQKEKIKLRTNDKDWRDFSMKNNYVVIIGKFVSGFEYSHESFGEKFYRTMVAVKRLSDQIDYIPLIVPERLIDISKNYMGQCVCIKGQFRSLNWSGAEKQRLILSVFVTGIEFIDEITENANDNQIFLNGYVCKKPINRKTPLGREITDLLVAVHRSYGKSDYIPCICWGKDARLASGFKIGDCIRIDGRIQSREYAKKLPNDVTETRVAYEVSVSKVNPKRMPKLNVTARMN